MDLRFCLTLLAMGAAAGSLRAQEEPPVTVPEVSEKDAQEASDDYMRDELGVNDVTAPSIAKVLKDLGTFHPIAMEVVEANPRDAVFDNRLQTAFHIGALVADGFVLTIAERPRDLQDIGRELIRQSRALGVGERLTKRSKSLFEYSDKGDWQGMREELIRTQADVEKTMMDLRDEQMAHMISLGGWLRGFQLAANSCAQNYQPEKATILARAELMDYYIDRLETLHPRLRQTEFVGTFTQKLKDLRTLAQEAPGGIPSQQQVKTMRDLANEIEGIALGRVDEEGRIVVKNPPTP